MLVVWEPILPGDWEPPKSSTLSRISDSRVRQFWDPKHLISATLKKIAAQNPTEPKLDPGERYYWDLALLFDPNTKWETDPHPSFWQGPVYKVISGLSKALIQEERSVSSLRSVTKPIVRSRNNGGQKSALHRSGPAALVDP